MEKGSESIDSYGFSEIQGFMWVDIDQAVNRTLNHIEGHSGCRLMDGIAAYQIDYRPFLSHPKIQDYYFKEGKWIDYLPDRVPEYAKYAK